MLRPALALLPPLLLPLLLSPLALAQAPLERLASDLANPRGVAVVDEATLLVIEAGTGTDRAEARARSGRLTLLEDRDADGDFGDPGERRALLEGYPSYNGLEVFRTRRDEVGGLGDLLLLPDGRLLFTRDDPFPGYAADGSAQEIGVVEWSLAGEAPPRTFARRFATVNALAYDPAREVLYLAESGMNRLVTLDAEGRARSVTAFGLLEHGQQAVPAGLALEPDGTVLVALFSGSLEGYAGADGAPLAYMPGDARVVRVDPESGAVTDLITGLTTAVDVAVDEAGNVYVLELSTGWPAAPMPEGFDLYAPDAPPDAGGYPRFSGRVTRYGPDLERTVLAEGLDAPTNLTYDGGTLYISSGQGTPGRPIWGPSGATRISGELYRLELP